MKKLIALFILSLLLVQCNKEDKYLIAKNQLGEIKKGTSVAELDKIFANDSVIKQPENTKIFNRYVVYKKGGVHLLTIKLRVNRNRDSIKGIENIKIISNQYKTEKGLNTSSTFKDILDKYTVNKIEPSFTSALVFIDEINITVALDKKDLKLNEFDMNKISQDQIPDMANIKYLTLWFD